MRRVSTRTRGVVHGAVDVATRKTGGGGLLHANLVALGDLAFELLAADLTPLSEGDVEGLGTDHLVVHLGDGLGGLVGRGEADETEALGSAFVVAHDLATGDRPERLEFGAKFLIIDVVLKVLDVKVNALVLAEFLHLCGFVRLAQLLLAFGFLLSTGDEEFLAVEVGVVKSVDGFGGLLMVFEVNETEALALALLIGLDDGRRDGTELREKLDELILSDLEIEVLHVKVGEVSTHLLKLGLTFLMDTDRINTYL